MSTATGTASSPSSKDKGKSEDGRGIGLAAAFGLRNASWVDIGLVVVGPLLFAMNLASSWSVLRYRAGGGLVGGAGVEGEGIYPIPIVSLTNVQVEGDQFVDVKDCVEKNVLLENVVQAKLEWLRETLNLDGSRDKTMDSDSIVKSTVENYVDRLGETQLYSCDDLGGFLERLSFFLWYFQRQPLQDADGNLKVPTMATFLDFHQNNLYASQRPCDYDEDWLDKFIVRKDSPTYNDFTSFMLHATARLCYYSDTTITMEKPVLLHTSITDATATKNILPFVTRLPEWVSVRVAVEEGTRLALVSRTLGEETSPCEPVCQYRWKCESVYVTLVPVQSKHIVAAAGTSSAMTLLKWLAYDVNVRKRGESISVLVQEGSDIDGTKLRTAVANYREENVVTGSGIFFARSEINAAHVQPEYLAKSSHAIKSASAYFGANLKVSALEAASIVVLDSHHLKSVATSSMFTNLVTASVADCSFGGGGVEPVLNQVISTVVRTMNLVIVSDPGLPAMIQDTLHLQKRTGSATASSSSSNLSPSASWLSHSAHGGGAAGAMLCSSPLLLGPKKSALLLLPNSVLHPNKKFKAVSIQGASSMVYGLAAFGDTAPTRRRRQKRQQIHPHEDKFFVVDGDVDIVYTIGADHLLFDGVDLKFTSECTIYAFGGQDLEMAVFYVFGKYYIQTNVTSVIRLGGHGDYENHDGQESLPERACTSFQLQMLTFPEELLSSPLLPFLPLQEESAALQQMERKVVKMSQVTVTHLLE